MTPISLSPAHLEALQAMDESVRVFDARQKTAQLYRAEWECQINEGASLEDAKVMRELALLHEFDARSLQFRHFWFASNEVDATFRALRPEWPFLSPRDFERLGVGLLFLAQNRVYDLTPATRDGGFDLVYQRVHHFREGLSGTHTALAQCKLLRGTVPVADVRDFVGTVYARNAEGVFLSNAPLSTDGRSFIHQANQGLRGAVVSALAGVQFSEFLTVCETVRSALDALLNARCDGEKESLAKLMAQRYEAVQSLVQEGYTP